VALAEWAASAGPAGGRLPVVGIDNVPGSVPIEGYQLPPECVLLFGQESTGLTAEAQAACDVVLHITQYGSTRSINAGAAAAIAMHAWAVRHAG
jgi:tRNA G18 (ribose-2'-O)-methylase SpoU